MKIIFEKDHSTDKFISLLSGLAESEKSLMILSCADNNYDIEKINKILLNLDIPIFGGSFPKIIYKNKVYDKGVIFVCFDELIKTAIIEDVSSQHEDELYNLCADFYDNFNENSKTTFIFIDGLSDNISDFLLSVFENFGLNTNYIGAGTGNFPFLKKESVFTNRGYLKDCAILASSSMESSLDVGSGWKRISEPMKITYHKGKLIQELDYEDAFEKYKNIVEKYSKHKITKDKPFESTMLYPLGLSKLSGEDIVRTILNIDEEGILLSEKISNNSFLSVLNSNNETLLNISKELSTSTKDDDTFLTFIIECLSRDLILKEDFQKEIDIFQKGNENFIGVLSLGEIANNKNRFLEIYNQSIVISKIKKEYG